MFSALPTQMPLPFALHERTALVTMETARARWGVDADTIHAWIECGEITWAWDISSGGGERRELRIWARELIAPHTSANLAQDAVIEAVIGTRIERLRSVEVGKILLASRPLMLRLVRDGHLDGPLVGHTQYITRASLDRFLRDRLVT